MTGGLFVKNTLSLDGTNLSLEVIISLLEGNEYEITLLKQEKKKLKWELVSHEKTLVNAEEVEATHDTLPRNYAACYGKMLPAEIGMASLVLLLNESIKYTDTIREKLIERIMEFINHKIYPCIHDMNKYELSAMSELALIISGEGKTTCFYKGKYSSTQLVLKELKMDTFNLTDNEVQFMMNICCVSTALSILMLKDAKKICKTADICVAMNLEAIRGEVGAFDKRLHELARPYPNQIISAKNTRRLLEDSEFTTEKARIAFGGDKGARCQDAICLRATPQTHGGVRDTIQWLESNLNKEINNISYKVNPIVGYSLDLVIIALADLGNISERRSSRLNDSHLSYGLPMNLVGENPGFNHGFPVIQAAATAVLAELKLLSLPNSSSVIIDSMNKNYNCATYAAAFKSIEVINLITKVLAIEMLMAAQGMDLAKDKLKDYKFGKGTEVALVEFRNYIKVTRKNRFAVPDMVEADRLVNQGIILAKVENTIGKLN